MKDHSFFIKNHSFFFIKNQHFHQKSTFSSKMSWFSIKVYIFSRKTRLSSQNFNHMQSFSFDFHTILLPRESKWSPLPSYSTEITSKIVFFALYFFLVALFESKRYQQMHHSSFRTIKVVLILLKIASLLSSIAFYSLETAPTTTVTAATISTMQSEYASEQISNICIKAKIYAQFALNNAIFSMLFRFRIVVIILFFMFILCALNSRWIEWFLESCGRNCGSFSEISSFFKNCCELYAMRLRKSM